MNPSRRLARHLSFANVVACLALFVALGGSAYAGSKINGNSIAKQSIGGGKLKNETITSRQIKKGTINSSVIDISTLTTVPSAQTAVNADSASSANTANSAKTADTATSAGTATKATSAETAARATNADHATSADTATQADSADTATTAAHADTAGDADAVGGQTAAELTDSCPADTTLFGGICWDDAARPLRTWVGAAKECAAEGGRLPTLSELVAYVEQGDEQAPSGHWSSDVAGLNSGEEQVMTASDTGREAKPAGLSLFKYRCLFYRTNAG